MDQFLNSLENRIPITRDNHQSVGGLTPCLTTWTRQPTSSWHWISYARFSQNVHPEWDSWELTISSKCQPPMDSVLAETQKDWNAWYHETSLARRDGYASLQPHQRHACWSLTIRGLGSAAFAYSRLRQRKNRPTNWWKLFAPTIRSSCRDSGSLTRSTTRSIR